MTTEITVGIAGAAGDGLDRTGDTLARNAARMGLHIFTYNSYQSLIRGGHTWLRLRVSEKKVDNHGDHLNVLIALNQDSIERHSREVEPGGAIIFNSAKVTCDSSLVPEGVTVLPLPVPELTKGMGRLLPVMQNTVALGALLHLMGFDAEVAIEILAETFRHKGEEIIQQNVNVLRAGFQHAAREAKPLGYEWKATGRRRPIVNGNQMIALGAVAAGCKFYTAYPMSPATSILHWFASHSEKCGVLVKQAEDELAVINIAIGAAHAGVRSMCATSGGGFALMTEAIGMAGIMEMPVVIVNVMRGGPSTGLPTKTEQADLNQAVGASQGDFPRVIVAPSDAKDCYHVAARSHNLAEKYQLPVIILSDLMLAEHRSTVDPDDLPHDVSIERGEWVTDPAAGSDGGFKRYRLTPSGISPRARPGTKGLMHITPSDDHDERGVLISDEHTNSAIRRKMSEKRMKKMDLLRKELEPPALEGPADADVTLIGWGSTKSVIGEAAAQLTVSGLTTNQLHFRWIHPFHAEEALEILQACNTTIVVENNFSGQFARHLRAETGFTADDLLVRYDGEPFEPKWVADRIKNLVDGKSADLRVQPHEASEMAYHYARIHMKDQTRPGKITAVTTKDHDEPIFEVEMIGRVELEPRGHLIIGRDTGSIFGFQPPERIDG